MGVPLIAEARQMYDGVWIRRGERFTVRTEAEALDLIAIHFASRAVAALTDDERLSSGRYMRRDERAAKSKG